MSGLAKSAKGQGAHVCVFCGQDKNNEDQCGKLLSRAGITAHYFCMLFSSGLSQNGAEKSGVLGFMPDDIRAEVKRGSKLRCTYCRTKGATIGCVIKNCRRVFHLHCGRTNDTLHQYFDNFSSFCPTHRPQQDVEVRREATEVCSICMVDVSTTPGIDNIQAPCCRRCWYHRECVQQHAQSAGLYFFKCPLCNNKDDFQQEMLTFGIYIPDQDASWETEPAAYRELLERYRHCDAATCRCPHGRDHYQEHNKWEIILCDFCGSEGCHAACKHLLKLGKKDICPGCYLIDQREKAERLAKRTPEKRKSLELLRQLEMATSPDSEKQAGSTFPGPSGHYRKAGIPKKVASAVSSKTGFQKNGKPTASKSSLSTASAASNNRYNLPGTSWGAVEKKRKLSGSSDGNTSFKKKKVRRSLDLSQNAVPSSSQQRSKAGRKLRKGESESLWTLIQNSVLKKKGKKLLTKNSKQRRAGVHKGSLSSNGTAFEASAVSGTCADSLNKSPLSKQSKKKKKIEADPLQTTLTNWFKPESSSPKLKRNKSQPSSTVTTEHEKPSLNASVKLPVIEWHGRKLLIRSPRVVVERMSMGSLFNKRLEIDMQDGNDGLWSADLDTLNSLECKGRITRKMVHSHEWPSAQSTDSATEQCIKLEGPGVVLNKQTLDSSPSKNVRKRKVKIVSESTAQGMESISTASHSKKILNVTNSALEFKTDKKKDGLRNNSFTTGLDNSPVKNRRCRIEEANCDKQKDAGETMRSIDIHAELEDSPANNLRKHRQNSQVTDLDVTDKIKEGLTIKSTPIKLDSPTQNMRSWLVEGTYNQNDTKKDSMGETKRTIDNCAELKNSPARNFNNSLKHFQMTEEKYGQENDSKQKENMADKLRTIDIREDSPSKNLRNSVQRSQISEAIPTDIHPESNNSLKHCRKAEEKYDQRNNNSEQKENIEDKMRTIDIREELEDSPAKNLRDRRSQIPKPHPVAVEEINPQSNSRPSRSPVRSPAQKVLSFPLESSTNSLKARYPLGTDDKLIMSDYYSSKHSHGNIAEGQTMEMEFTDWSDDSDIVELPMLGAIVGMI